MDQRCPLLLAALLASSCAAAPPSAPTETLHAASKHEVTEAEARRIAEKTAEAGGFAPGDYVLRSIEQIKEGPFAGTWAVFFEHVPPAPPGGHCTVYVRMDDGSAQLFPGK
jgi:hypothetical protein